VPETKKAETAVAKNGDVEDILDELDKTVEAVKKAGKRWFRSKVVWFNILSLIAVIAAWLAHYPEYAEAAGLIAAAVNIGLRWTTKEAITP
jgi:uncharacterized membrane protein